MNIQQEWQNMTTEIDAKQTNHYISENSQTKKSHNLLNEVLFKLKWKLRWLRIIDLPILAAAFFVKGDLQLLLIFFFICYEIFRWFLMNKLNNIKAVADYSSNTMQVLDETRSSLKSILKIENLFGYIFLPLAGPIGFLAAKLYKYGSFENIFNTPNFLLQLALTLIIGLPLIFLAQKMNNSIFKQPIEELNFKIEQLKEE